MSCVTSRDAESRMTTSVTTASTESGRDLPLILILLNIRMTGCPSSDTTKAASTYTSTLLKYQQAAQTTAATASFIIHPDSLSTFLSFSIVMHYFLAGTKLRKQTHNCNFAPFCPLKPSKINHTFSKGQSTLQFLAQNVYICMIQMQVL